MKDYVILTDSGCDLPKDLVKDLDVNYIGLVCLFKGSEYIEDCGQSLSYKDFYKGIREGEQPTTGQVNSYRFAQEFEKHVEANKAVIYIAFSSALSGTYNSSLIARNEVLEKYPNADITIIDSKLASGGHGLLVYLAARKRQEGSTKEDLVKWIDETYLRVNSYFFVEDLNHLKRGGRISATSALVGGMLNIKPILHVNDEGKLINIAKAKGRKKAISTLFDYAERKMLNPEDQTIVITHADCLEDAETFAENLKKHLKVKEVIINYIGLAIGSHTGAGAMTVFFIGENRNP
ncbi:DegV family protein [Clostridium sp. YIM B02506]|uniref:DegV family protein n=1 Tax=Clostridium sp. YIM B02506 TaxID=2910680 RepID=UPI001EEDE893|nr:DegV family protein [Clostridium sp. YIM B02506]